MLCASHSSGRLYIQEDEMGCWLATSLRVGGQKEKRVQVRSMLKPCLGSIERVRVGKIMVKALRRYCRDPNFNGIKGKIYDPEYGPMKETRVIKKHSALELLKIGKFKQVTKEPVSAWLVRLWYTVG